jgi:anti-sigma factor RsiW
MLRRIHARMSWVSLNVGAPRSVFQAETVYPPPGHAEGRTGVDMKVWSHGPYKCAVIVRIQNPFPFLFLLLTCHTASF